MDDLFWRIFWRNKRKEIKEFLLLFVSSTAISAVIFASVGILFGPLGIVVLLAVLISLILFEWIRENIQRARAEAEWIRKVFKRKESSNANK